MIQQTNPMSRPSFFCVAANGAKVDLGKSSVKSWLKHGHFWLLMFVIILIMAHFDPAKSLDVPWAANTSIAFWTAIVLVYLLLLFPSLFVLKSVLLRFGFDTLYLPISSIPIVFVLMHLGQVVIILLEEQRLGVDLPTYGRFFLYYALEQTFQVLYISMVLPKIARLDGDTPGKPNTSKSHVDIEKSYHESNRILIGKTHFTLNSIKYIASCEHYIMVVDGLGDHLVRAKFSETLLRFSDSDGIRIHRSHWLSKAKIDFAQQSSGQLSIVLKDGTEFSVARSRRNKVFDWLSQQDIDIR